MPSGIRNSNIPFATLLLTLIVFASQSIEAAPTVINTADNGPGSLRQAIIDATAAAAATTIDFAIPTSDPGYDLPSNRFTITLLTALPVLPVAPLTIDNTMTSGVTVKGGSNFRVFTLVNGAVVVINKLTISDGTSNGVGDFAKGGGIFMGDSATLTLNNSVVSDNDATDGGGGVWINDSGTLHVLDSTIRDNTTTGGNGGGIHISNSGTLNISGSTVSSNHADAVSPGGGGGGIYNGVSGTINATNITVNGNSAGNQGGGISTNATITLNSSTISSNTATVAGGGIFNGPTFTATLNNSLIALNSSPDGPDLKGTFTANFSLVGNDTGSIIAGANNQLGSTASPINPQLGPLQGNGGPTFTRALLFGSPAIDSGETPLTNDQRGVTFLRPKDGDGVGGAQDDIGAFEADLTFATALPALVVVGSSGKVDESDKAEHEFRNQFATITDGITGTVTYRYNLAAVEGFRNGAGPFTIRIRYRDNGPNQNITVRLRAANVIGDGVTSIYTFNSDTGSTANSALAGTGSTTNPNGPGNQTWDECNVQFVDSEHINHGRYMYFLEVDVTRTTIDGTASPGFIGFVISQVGITGVSCDPG